MKYLLKGKYVYTDFAAGDSGLLRNAAVYIEDTKILEVGNAEALCKKYPDAEVLGGDAYVVMPGIVNAHSHGSGLSHVQRGIGFDFLENSLYDWAQCITLPPELNAPMTALRHLRNGCTTMHHNVMGAASDATAYDTTVRYLTAYQKTGMRVAYSPGIRDVNALISDDEAFYQTLPPDLQAFAYKSIFFDKARARDMYFEWFEQTYQTFNSDMTKIFLGPCWAHGATDELLTRVKQTAEDYGHLPIHIHTLQTPIQRGYGLKKYGMSLLKRLDLLGVVDDNLTLGHAVYLDENDIQILKDKNASVTHHASCNLAMRNGISPVWYLQRAGVNVALGIDEKSINDDEDAFMELRMIYYLSRVSGFDLTDTKALTPYEVLSMGTRNAARTLGLENKIGALKPQMQADVVVMELSAIENDPCVVPNADPAMTLIHRALGRYVTDVFVNGKPVIRDKKCLTIDKDALYEEVRKFAAKDMPEKNRINAENMQKLKPYMQAWYKDMDDFERVPFYPVNSKK
ncbi:MAG TPA: amidohydrolase family protein [Clostridia bacterium]|nr:amidohydrolase family protein [Clostridia bacterium]